MISGRRTAMTLLAVALIIPLGLARQEPAAPCTSTVTGRLEVVPLDSKV
jgi:hypothetical protein